MKKKRSARLESALLNKTLILLESTGYSLNSVANDLGYTREFLRKVVNGMIQDPGVKKIETLYHYLVDRRAADIERERDAMKHEPAA